MYMYICMYTHVCIYVYTYSVYNVCTHNLYIHICIYMYVVLSILFCTGTCMGTFIDSTHMKL